MKNNTTTFKPDKVVPWGRSFAEYARMFALGETELAGRIVGCGDGPASFNAEATARGGRVVSCDPIYGFSAEEIGKRIEESYSVVMAQTRANAGQFVWGAGIDSLETLGAVRMAAMRRFLADYEAGRNEGRYLERALPELGFEAGSFDLALCSHFLFLYSDQFDAAFHVAAVAEMVRVAQEARIFPLLGLDARPSPHLGAVMDEMGRMGVGVEIVAVDYEFQRGGNQMMRVRR